MMSTFHDRLRRASIPFSSGDQGNISEGKNPKNTWDMQGGPICKEKSPPESLKWNTIEEEVIKSHINNNLWQWCKKLYILVGLLLLQHWLQILET